MFAGRRFLRDMSYHTAGLQHDLTFISIQGTQYLCKQTRLATAVLARNAYFLAPGEEFGGSGK